jgi:hypothetical protein
MNGWGEKIFFFNIAKAIGSYIQYLCSYRTCIHGSELTPTCPDSPTGKCGPEVQVHLKLRKVFTCGHINHIVDDIICVRAATPSLHSTGHIVLVAMFPTPISAASTKSIVTLVSLITTSGLSSPTGWATCPVCPTPPTGLLVAAMLHSCHIKQSHGVHRA